MPKYTFTSPQGEKYVVNGPEGSTEEQAWGILQQQLGGVQQQQYRQSVPDAMATGLGMGLSGIGAGLGEMWDSMVAMPKALGRSAGAYTMTEGDPAEKLRAAREEFGATMGREVVPTTNPIGRELVDVTAAPFAKAAELGGEAMVALEPGVPEWKARQAGEMLGGMGAAVAPIPLLGKGGRQVTGKRVLQPDDVYQYARPKTEPGQYTVRGTETTKPTRLPEDIPRTPNEIEVTSFSDGTNRIRTLSTEEMMARQALLDTQDPYRIRKEKSTKHPKIYSAIDSPIVAAYKVLPATFAENIRKADIKTKIAQGKYDPIVKELEHVEKVYGDRFDAAWKNQDSKAVDAMLDSIRPGLAAEMRAAIDDVGTQAKAVGMKFSPIAAVNPRWIDDWEFFKAEYQAAYGKAAESWDRVDRSIKKINDELAQGKININQATERFEKALTKRVKRGIIDPTSTHVKARKFDKVPERLRPAYASPSKSMRHYFNEMAAAIEERKFLGRGADKTQSINAKVAEFAKKGGLDYKQQQDLRRILESLYGPEAKKAMSPFLSNMRDVGMMGTIANPLSTMIQATDALSAALRHGPWNALRALQQAAVRPSKRAAKNIVDPADLGVFDILQEMVGNPTKVKLALDSMFKWTGFKAIDRFGKRTHLNAALNKFERWAKSDNAKLKQQYGELVDDWDGFREALLRRDITHPDVRLAVFNELARVQPILRSDLPIWYLNNPNGRIVYSLKTWALRFINTVREDIMRGRKDVAGTYAAGLGLMTGSVDLARDLVKSMFSGEELKPEDIPKELLDSMLKMGFLSEYGLTKVIEQGDISSIIGQIAPPALNILAALIADVASFYEEGELPEDPKSDRYVPIAGPFIDAGNKQ